MVKWWSVRLGGEVVERPPRLREVAGSIPGRVILKTSKMVVMAALLGDRVTGLSLLRVLVGF